jgi:hypothetical protein
MLGYSSDRVESGISSFQISDHIRLDRVKYQVLNHIRSDIESFNVRLFQVSGRT